MAQDKIVLKIAGDVSQLQSDVNKANAIMSHGLGKIQTLAQGVNTTLAGLGAGLSAGVFTAWVKGGIEAADQMNEVSKRTGVTVEDLSNLKYAVEQSGGSWDALTTGLNKFEVNLAKAGISGQQTIPMLQALSDEFNRTQDPAKRLEIAVKAFGKSAGPDLVEFLSLGSTAIGDLVNENKRLGGELSGATAQAADDFNDRMSRLQTLSTAAAAAVGGGLVQAFGDFGASGISPELLGNLQAFGTLLGNISRVILEQLPLIGRLTGAWAGAKIGASAGRLLGPEGAAAGALMGGAAGLAVPEIASAKAESELKKADDRLTELQQRAQALRDRAAKGTAQIPLLGFEFKLSDKDLQANSQKLAKVDEQIATATATRDKLAAAGKPVEMVGPPLPKVSPQTDLQKFLSKTMGEDVGGGGGRAKGLGGLANDPRELLQARYESLKGGLQREQELLQAQKEFELVKLNETAADEDDDLKRRDAVAQQKLAIEIRFNEAVLAKREQLIGAEIEVKRQEAAITEDRGQQAKILADVANLEGQLAQARQLNGIETDKLRAAEKARVAEADQAAARRLLSGTPGQQAIERARDQNQINELMQRGVINAQQAQEAMDQIANRANDANDSARQLGITFASAFEDAIVGGKNMSEMLKGLEQDIMRILTRKIVTEPLTNAITKNLPNFGNLFGGTAAKTGAAAAGGGGMMDMLYGIGNWFGGFFADGGFPPIGKYAVVGEHGPELIRPRQAMQVLPMAGGGGVTVNVNVSGITDSGQLRASASQIALQAGRAADRALKRR